MNEAQIHEANSELRRLGRVYVYLHEYRITHGAAHVLITGETFRPFLAHVYLVGCSHISGPTEGGLWQTRIRRSDGRADEIVFESSDGGLTIAAWRAVVKRA